MTNIFSIIRDNIRRGTWAFMLLAGLFCANIQSCKKEHVQPNILFIAVDDLRTELGVYGKPVVKSPHLDNLANSGTLFMHHYVQVPTCGASRYALLTGRRPGKRIHLTNAAIELEIADKAETSVPESFIHQLRRAGYHTVGIGKIGHSADGFLYGYDEPVSSKRELPYSWDEMLFNAGKWKTGWNAFFGYADGENRQSLKKQVKPYEAGAVDDQGYPDGLTTRLAMSKLRELKGRKQPFFMGVGYFKPHLPFNSPKKYWELYNRQQIPVSANPGIPENIHPESLHDSGEFNQYALGDEVAGLSEPVSETYARKLRHAYLASVSYIDAQVGILYDELKVLGLDKNTIVIVWGDHGWHLGDQAVWGKHTLFENALKSTLIIKSPSPAHTPKKVEHIVETVDLYPTLMDLCGLQINHQVDGESLVGLMESTDTSSNNTAYSYYKNGISMRTEAYRLTKYFRQEEPVIELYDHTTDSDESSNVAQLKPQVVTRLMPLLEKGNTGIYTENN